MPDQFSWWREALAAGRGVETERGNPRSGYYRNRNEALVFWYDDDRLLCWRSDKSKPTPTKPDEIDDLFGFCAPHPVNYEDYQFFRKEGRWPEQIAAQIVDEDLPTDKKAEAKLIALRDEAGEWLKFIGGEVTTKPEADKAANFAEAFAKLEKELTETHRVAKMPILAAGREVDSLWKPLIDKAAVGKGWAKRLCEPFLRAEKARLDAEEAARRAATAEAEAKGAPAPPQSYAPPARAKVGTAGRAVHLRKQKVVVVTDMWAFLTHLAEQNDHPTDFVQAVNIQARRMIAAGLKPPGVEQTEEEVAS